MSFATAIAKPVSTRYLLARIRPARDVTSLVSSAGGGVYTLTFSYPIASVKRNGSSLTSTTANPPTVNDTYYHDEATGTFKVKLADVPHSITNILILTYQLFYASSDAGVASYETPTSSATTLRQWQPRIDGDPVFSQSAGEATEGALTIAGGSIDLRNEDRAFNAYLTINDSFYQKDIDIWLAVDGELSHVYHGKIGALYVGDTVSISFYDAFSRLQQVCFMGDTSDEAYFKRETGSFLGVTAADHMMPVPYVFGRSAHKLSMGIVGVEVFASVAPGSGTVVSTFPTSYSLNPDGCRRAPCTSHPSSSSTSTATPWGIARASSAGFKTLNFGTIGSATLCNTNLSNNYDGNFRYHGTDRARLKIYATRGSHNIEVGDSFRWTHASVNAGAAQYAVVMAVYQDFDDLGNFYDDIIDCMVLSRSTVAADVTVTSLSITANQGPGLVIDGDDGHYFPVYTRDFTVTVSTTSSGNKYMRVNLVNGFESGNNHDGVAYHPGLSTIHPDTHKVYFRVSTASGQSHADALGEILSKAGITVDAASFAAAETVLDADVSFMIPSVDESDYGTCIKYAQDVLRSTLGYLKYNPSTQSAEYYLLESPSSTDDVDATTYIGNVEVEIDYQDIATELVAMNPHLPIEVFTSAFSTATSNRALYLHGIAGRSATLTHVLEDISDRLADILAIKAERRAVYRIATATKYLDAELGDDLQLTSDDVLGASTDDLKIIGISKGAHGVVVEATDLGGT
jgi:hypothetical protein